MDKKCDACEYLRAPTNQILTTSNWTVGIGNDQPYLGRAYLTLKKHKGKIGELSSEEWQDFQEIIAKLEITYKKAFGADVLNIECNMNHAFKTEPYNPHIHWHIYPRYKNPPEVDAIVFDDPLFGSHIDEDLVKKVSDEVVEQIASRLRNSLS